MIQSEYHLLLLGGYILYEFLAKRYLNLGKQRLWKQALCMFFSLYLLTVRYLSWIVIADIFIIGAAYFLFTAVEEERKQNKKEVFEYYLGKQIVLVLLILFIPYWYPAIHPAEWFNGLWKMLAGNTSVPIKKIIILIAGYAFVVDGGTHIVRGVLQRFPNLSRYAMQSFEKKRKEKLKKRQETESTDSLNISANEEERAGELIGIIERLLILTFVIVQSYEAVAFAVAAKSVARFSLLDDKDFAEYYLLGTSLSVIIAVFVGLAVRSLAF